MTWFKVSDRMYGSPAVVRAGNAAIGMWVTTGAWCARYRPDGFVPDALVKRERGGRRLADRLTEAGMWERGDGGWWFTLEGPIDLWWIERDQEGRRKIPASVRQFVLDRDGNACLFCGSTENLTMDHVHPFSLGGSDDPSNLQTLCMPCNRAKGAKVNG